MGGCLKFKRVSGWLIIFSLFVLFAPSPVYPITVSKEEILPNGLKVLVIEDHKAPIATFQIWYRVGSRNDPKGKTGISHLLEHMMFKGTEKIGPKQFSRIIQRNGGIDNAYTTKDYTMYFETLSSDRINLAIELEADRMKNLLLRKDDSLYERSVVMEERRMRYEDDPQRSLYEEVVATAFKVHPYHNPVIGWMSDLGSIQQEDLLLHYSRYYAPENAVVVIAGDVNPEEILQKIKEEFGSIKKTAKRPVFSSKEPVQRGQKRVYLKKEAKLPYILIAYHVPSFPDKDSAALDVLSYILSGKSGRLYKNLVRTKEIALNAFASYSGFYIDPYLFFLGGTVRPGRKAEDLERAFYEEIKRIQETPPTEREIQKAKNQVEASFIMEQDSIYNQAELIGMFEMLGDWRLIDKYLKMIREVRPEDVQRVARKYFTEDNRTVGILIPEKRGVEK